MTEVKRLYRSNKDYILAGVCGGLGEYLGVDVLVIRLLFVIAMIWGGGGIIIYLILAIVVPREPGKGVVVDREEKVREMVEEVGERVKKLKKK
ncbi:hypothetical protein A3K55_00010 [Candidatus Shapirobacteria bacterium RBG_13_44_7]|uniref:Phage shock protein PspC N-terminal domain-containing protein n=1 Tax=Candidatus Shapirobacteria bacterium RBG_13_44_7 TaxID=1802149 RepID=A0A1F7SG98_9BACT|nr:MAG: hypothetical protein A3K55_00010 [Candidatus Shapirobacteria bacterium RBG_13_44_7]